MIFFTPAGAESEIAALRQRLGFALRALRATAISAQRMRAALEESARTRAAATPRMLVGSDIPLLSAQHLIDARETLAGRAAASCSGRQTMVATT